MLKSINLPISCNFSSFPHLKPSRKAQSLSQPRNLTLVQSRAPLPFLKPDRILLGNNNRQFLKHEKKGLFHVCRSSLNNPDPDKTEIQDEGRDWTSSVLLFALWGALLYYCFNLAPDQTPIIMFFMQTQDLYFLKKLLNLKGDDGFRMNQILVGLWYIMGLWPVVYAMLLLPTGRSKTRHGLSLFFPSLVASTLCYLILHCGILLLLPFPSLSLDNGLSMFWNQK
ncbi:unnamed protein product [Brassica oleracea]